MQNVSRVKSFMPTAAKMFCEILVLLTSRVNIHRRVWKCIDWKAMKAVCFWKMQCQFRCQNFPSKLIAIEEILLHFQFESRCKPKSMKDFRDRKFWLWLVFNLLAHRSLTRKIKSNKATRFRNSVCDVIECVIIESHSEMFTRNLRQCNSSDRSTQSGDPLQRRLLSMHCPFLHLKWVFLQSATNNKETR